MPCGTGSQVNSALDLLETYAVTSIGDETSKEDQERYKKLATWLRHVVHELPAGVLYGHDGASEAQSQELMRDLYEFEELSRKLSRSNAPFVVACRWHFEHYPHYLSRQRHFGTYKSYIEKRGGQSVFHEHRSNPALKRTSRKLAFCSGGACVAGRRLALRWGS